MGLHCKTPSLTVNDPRRLTIRSVGYWRRAAQTAAESRVERTAFGAAGRAVKQWDARLWALQGSDPQTPANLRNAYSLSGRPVRTDSVDAGTHIGLAGPGAEVVFEWDSRQTYRETEHDKLLRPVAVFEKGIAQPRLCTQRFSYGKPGAGDQALNQFGQLIRHDDPAGSALFDAFSIAGHRIETTRHFTLDPVTPDWPEPIIERQRLLEPGPGALSRCRFGALGDVLELVDARGNVQAFDTTLDGRLRACRLKLQSSAQPVLAGNFRYNAEGGTEQHIAGNGVQTDLAYRREDGLLIHRRAVDATGKVLQHLTYDYDPVGNVLSIEDKVLPIRYFANQRIEPISRFVYDTLYQLSEATGWEAGGPWQGPQSISRADPAAISNYRQTYHYDAGGNLLGLTHVGAQDPGRRLKAARYSNRCLAYRNDAPPTEEAIAAAFDARGNLLELDQGRRVHWNLLNQLQSISPVERTGGLDDQEIYVYDGNGQRVRKLRSLQTRARTVLSEVRYLPGLELRTNSGTGEILHVITLQDGLNSLRVLHWETAPPSGTNDHFRYQQTDHLGSVCLELAADARIISREAFYPYGETAWLDGDAVEVSYKTVRYSGKECDATGLTYYGLRYYASRLLRWMNADPAGYVDGHNLFRMVRNNPMTLIDSNGLAPEPTGSVVSRLRQQFSGPAPVRPPAPISPHALARPAVPARPAALSPMPPARPPLPGRLSPEQVNAPLTTRPAAPKRPPPPVALPVASGSSSSLPFYAVGAMAVGSHSLMIGMKGGVVLMRGDNRDPDQIRKAGGFYPRDNRGSAIKNEFRQSVVTKKINTVANEHVRSPVPGYVSTGIDEDSGGYGDSRGYLYRMEIPGLKERAINDQTLGLGAPFSFTPKGQLDARLLMSADVLDDAEFVGMIPPRTVEMTMITPIPAAYIVAYRQAGSAQWTPF